MPLQPGGAMQDEQGLIKTPVTIRPAKPGDAEQILSLVGDVVREQYGHLFPGEVPVPTDPGPWAGSWVAVAGDSVVGVGLADGDCIDDLWLRPPYRRRKIGSALLSILETQIGNGGHMHARLRIVAGNEGARKFYARQGWQETKVYPHERWAFMMVDMQKDLRPGP